MIMWINLENGKLRKGDYIRFGKKIASLWVMLGMMFGFSACGEPNISTPDTATRDTATKDTAVKSTTQPTTVYVTTEPTTVKPTEKTKKDKKKIKTTSPPTEPPTKKVEVQAETKTITKSNNTYNTSSDEVDLLARVIYCEAGNCSEYCQWLVGSTAMNLADSNGGLRAVAFDYNTFNVAGILYTRDPSELSYSVAQRILSGDRDYNVKAFRMSYYHSFGTPYAVVDNVYFSSY